MNLRSLVIHSSLLVLTRCMYTDCQDCATNCGQNTCPTGDVCGKLNYITRTALLALGRKLKPIHTLVIKLFVSKPQDSAQCWPQGGERGAMVAKTCGFDT
jgi:hypothetical protein